MCELCFTPCVIGVDTPFARCVIGVSECVRECVKVCQIVCQKCLRSNRIISFYFMNIRKDGKL